MVSWGVMVSRESALCLRQASRQICDFKTQHTSKAAAAPELYCSHLVYKAKVNKVTGGSIAGLSLKCGIMIIPMASKKVFNPLPQLGGGF